MSSRVSGCIWLAVALVLALVAGGVAFVTIQRATISQAQGEVPVATTSVVVAGHPMPVGSLITETDLSLQSFPTTAIPTGAMTTLAEASGKVTTTPLGTGEMILVHHLTEPDIMGGNLAFTLPEGLVGVTLSANDLLSSVQAIEPGHKVDILYSLVIEEETDEDTKDQQYTFGTLQAVEVVSVVRSAAEAEEGLGDAGSAPEVAPVGAARAYILALEPQDALTLKFLTDAGAVMDLALRNVADETDHAYRTVDLEYLVDKYQLRDQ